MESYASEWHEPVLVEEVLDHLGVTAGGRYIDGTLGGGGHTQAILDASGPDGTVVAFDRDATAIEFAKARLASYGARVTFVHGNYGDVETLAADHLPVDGFLVDAGVSSRQLDDASRGFSFRNDGPLDMRLGADTPTLAEYLDQVDEQDLANALYKWGEIKSSRRVAAAILQARRSGEVDSTTDLTRVVEETIGRGAGSGRNTRKIHPATLVFQALRIAVNRELEHLERALESIPRVVRSGGRAVFISFHSLEDRAVKLGFRDLSTDSLPPGLPIPADATHVEGKILTGRPVTPSDEEIQRNPRSRSAKLRALEVL